jgi:hypothetical protein
MFKEEEILAAFIGRTIRITIPSRPCEGKHLAKAQRAAAQTEAVKKGEHVITASHRLT